MFHPLDVAAITTGIVLQAPFRGQEVVQALAGQSIWTHQMVDNRLVELAQAAIAKQHPALPTSLSDGEDWESLRDRILAGWPEEISIEVDPDLAAYLGGRVKP
jgi:hypothetical protein